MRFFISYSIGHMLLSVNKTFRFSVFLMYKKNRKLKVVNLSSIVRHSEECYNGEVFEAPHYHRGTIYAEAAKLLAAFVYPCPARGLDKD